MPDTQSRELKGSQVQASQQRQTRWWNRQSSKWKQPEKRVSQSGCGAANWAVHPILPDTIHMGIRILLIRDGQPGTECWEAWTKVLRDLLKSNEDRVWVYMLESRSKTERNQSQESGQRQKKRWLEAKQGKPEDCRKPWSLRVSRLPRLCLCTIVKGLDDTRGHLLLVETTHSMSQLNLNFSSANSFSFFFY